MSEVPTPDDAYKRAERSLINGALLFGRYYQALIGARIPAVLARQMVMHFQAEYMERIIWGKPAAPAEDADA